MWQNPFATPPFLLSYAFWFEFWFGWRGLLQGNAVAGNCCVCLLRVAGLAFVSWAYNDPTEVCPGCVRFLSISCDDLLGNVGLEAIVTYEESHRFAEWRWNLFGEMLQVVPLEGVFSRRS